MSGKECIKKGILKEYLSKRGSEVTNMLIAEYDYETDMRVQYEEALEKGIAKGKTEEKSEVACNMLAEGCTVELISKVTGLTVEEIEKLKVQ